ncbi:hypothetical protein KUF00_004663 [Escherichia coli]|uniref:hypothetical protein n=1 Tax=Escherichia coli TaxID=562 RepID=UPI000AEE8ED8|nr:hypothetical protein [Escherichia coli]EKF6700573.1 hypothetical protein [Shigella flexneri]EKT7707939.1 hypothetical protein [Shigella sonnei]EHS0229456.1 hypothetical protein [Escherichia coli]EHW2678882.1 hypothetical protein [Escherichia coli]EHW6029143.1 hypothetical protein [Escherichia coli]
MQSLCDVLEKTLLQFGRRETAEQKTRNQKNLVHLRKMIDAARLAEKLEKQNRR